MKVCFWTSDKPRERILASAFLEGVRSGGDTGFERALQPEIEVADCDVAVMVGVKSRELFRAHWGAGVHVIYVDKGYTRHASRSPVKLWEFWRVAVDDHQPTASLAIDRPTDRLERLGLTLAPFRDRGAQVVLAGSSAKYHQFYGLHDPTRWCTKQIRGIAELSPGREIIYRPKPSWREAEPIEGARFSRPPETIEQVLAGAHILVTHGSNACFEAICAGVPVLALGPAAAHSIAETDFHAIERPRIPTEAERTQWLARLAYCQFKMKEFSSGEAWQILRPQIYV